MLGSEMVFQANTCSVHSGGMPTERLVSLRHDDLVSYSLLLTVERSH
jgi:hypothetical protein